MNLVHLTAASCLFLTAGAGAQQVLLTTQRLANNAAFSQPVFVTQPRTESQRLYVVEKTGRIRIIKNNAVLAAPFLDLSSIVATTGESGLLGLAFHPQFQANGYCYVYYNTGSAAVIARYTANPANPESASSPLQILAIPRPPGNHNGGWMGFSLDGFLYIACGDATNTTNPQNLTTLLGKMLRINPNFDDFPADPNRNYRLPIANPFYGSASAAPEIWAFGLRNPWRNSFDRVAGDLWVADVGNARPGEVNFQPKAVTPPFTARNYGWPCMDGSFCRGNSTNCTCGDPVLTAPVFDYDYAFGGNATVGGYVYRGSRIPALQGTYIFGDYQGKAWSFRLHNSQTVLFTNRTAEIGVPQLSSFGEDSAGELYLCSLSTGGIYTIVPACYANCDGSTTPPVLSLSDYQCFMDRFAAGDPYANCDSSTTAPSLNIFDYICFSGRFAAGCP